MICYPDLTHGADRLLEKQAVVDGVDRLQGRCRWAGRLEGNTVAGSIRFPRSTPQKGSN
jgi:hypothetical protein